MRVELKEDRGGGAHQLPCECGSAFPTESSFLATTLRLFHHKDLGDVSRSSTVPSESAWTRGVGYQLQAPVGDAAALVPALSPLMFSLNLPN